MRIFLHGAVWALLATYACCQDDMLGCGGFVRPVGTPDGSKKPDLSGVKAKLFTKGGLLKAETECAPNGYYYIPIYDRGAYTIRIEGPPGWMFDPVEREVSTREEGLCSQGKDVDFSIVGFALSGRVCSEGFSTGPSGVQMMLSGPKGAKYQTETEEGGLFSFKDAPPATYTLTAKHPTWKFRTDTVQTTMAFGQAEVRDTFGVLGYDLTGAAVWDDGSSLVELAVLLKPIDGSARPAGLLCPLLPGAAKTGAWCSATTNKNGEYVFEHVPPGDYSVSVDPAGAWAPKIEVEVASLGAKVEHGSSRVEQPIRVSGFSTGGKVLDAAGSGVEGAEVWVQAVGGEWRKLAETGKGGQYTLKGIKSGSYNLEARKQHMRFGTLTSYPITPQQMLLGSISVEKHALCGTIQLDSASPEGRTVVIAPASGRGSSVSIVSDAVGKFCHDVAPGEYRVSVASDGKVVIVPASASVSTAAGPELDVRFAQISLQVKGRVACLDSAGCAGVSVSLQGGPAAASRTLSVGADGRFEFADLAVGKYRVEAVRAGWCWAVQAAQVQVGVDYTGEVSLRQSGFSLSVRAPQAAELRLTGPGGGDSDAATHAVAAGENRLCVPKAGTYKVRHPLGC